MSYQKKYSLDYVNCVRCDYLYDTAPIGDNHTIKEITDLAERLHDASALKCNRKNRKLIISYSELLYEITRHP